MEIRYDLSDHVVAVNHITDLQNPSHPSQTPPVDDNIFQTPS